MSKKRGNYSPDDPRIFLAATIWRKSPNLSNGQALRAAEFSVKDSDKRTFQSRLARLVPNIRELRTTREEDLVYIKQVKKANQILQASNKVEVIEQEEETCEHEPPRRQKKRLSSANAQEARAYKKATSEYRDLAHERAVS